MRALSEGLHPQEQPPQPLLPGFPMGGGKNIVENDRTLRELQAEVAASMPTPPTRPMLTRGTVPSGIQPDMAAV